MNRTLHFMSHARLLCQVCDHSSGNSQGYLQGPSTSDFSELTSCSHSPFLSRTSGELYVLSSHKNVITRRSFNEIRISNAYDVSTYPRSSLSPCLVIDVDLRLRLHKIGLHENCPPQLSTEQSRGPVQLPALCLLHRTAVRTSLGVIPLSFTCPSTWSPSRMCSGLYRYFSSRPLHLRLSLVVVGSVSEHA